MGHPVHVAMDVHIAHHRGAVDIHLGAEVDIILMAVVIAAIGIAAAILFGHRSARETVKPGKVFGRDFRVLFTIFDHGHSAPDEGFCHVDQQVIRDLVIFDPEVSSDCGEVTIHKALVRGVPDFLGSIDVVLNIRGHFVEKQGGCDEGRSHGPEGQAQEQAAQQDAKKDHAGQQERHDHAQLLMRHERPMVLRHAARKPRLDRLFLDDLIAQAQRVHRDVAAIDLLEDLGAILRNAILDVGVGRHKTLSICCLNLSLLYLVLIVKSSLLGFDLM